MLWVHWMHLRVRGKPVMRYDFDAVDSVACLEWAWRITEHTNGFRPEDYTVIAG